VRKSSMKLAGALGYLYMATCHKNAEYGEYEREIPFFS